MTDASHRQDLSNFERFAAESQVRLTYKAFRMCGDWHEAEDLTQITLHRISQRWDMLQDREQLAGYTHRALVRTLISQRRRLSWTREVIRAELPDHGAHDPDRVDDRVTLLSAVDQLGQRQRMAVLLRFWADLSVDQTADIMRCSPGTVTSQTNRALKRLRVLLRPEGSLH